ncbi:MAG: type VI secretion system tip protein VgrG, partial [Deltaproteobacteria bacterium]|nr:type VI secretion system tip protein VgrG [Deltaproteobacteria bacterium]
MEVYDYPGIHLKKADGEPYAQIRREELQCRFQRFRAEGNIRGLATGGLFILRDHPRAAQNIEYLIAETEFELVSGEYEMGASEELSELYRCNLVATGSKVPFRSRLNTPKPVVRGPQTAVITGPKDAEIHTDKHGRVKVQFHWDRLGDKDEKSSCWIRVAQVWAGKGWGGVYNPRVGQEVIVDFLEGDPDRPIITGRVYNGVQELPYKLPDHQTRTTLMTHSTTKGTDKNFNELRFEDKKDEEEVYFHAEREFNRVVEENETLKVGMDKQEEGKGDRTVEIFNNRTVTLEKGNDKLQLKTGNRDIL